MNSRSPIKIRRIALIVGSVVLLAVALLFFRIVARPFWFSPPVRTLDQVSLHEDVRWCRLTRIDLRDKSDLLPTLRFNGQTVWPRPDLLPASFDPKLVLTNAMNPGLGVRDLHRRGITGAGVSVAIIDYSIFGAHPEYAAQVAEIYRIGDAKSPTMHGPAVTSLLVGAHCGTAPGAKLYFVVTPDPGGDAATYAAGLDWILKKNETLADKEKIRIVSVSATPSGKSFRPFKNPRLWDAAFERAEKKGILVIDGTVHHGFVGPCRLDPADPEDPAKCIAVLARNRPTYFDGRLLCPTSPRTVAEEYKKGKPGFQYCGLQKETIEAAGSSWAMPYCAGIAALGLQVRPELSPGEIRKLLLESAYVSSDGKRFINPAAFIAKIESNSANKNSNTGHASNNP